jgi:hypothetical protein
MTESLKTMETIVAIMTNTTIQISKETKKLISTFGSKEDTYEVIVRRLYDMAVKEQLRQLLMTSEGTISIDEARKRTEKKWPRSK